MTTSSFTQLLQLSISPIALISGAGLLLLSVTNRLSRSIDRSRYLALEIDKGGAQEKSEIREQLKILVKRSELLRNSVAFIGISIFLSTLMILGLSLRLFVGWSVEGLILTFLFLSVGCLCVSMVFFLLDVSLALKAIKIELGKYLQN